MHRVDKYVFDFKIAQSVFGIITALLEKGEECFLLADPDDSVENLEKFIKESIIEELDRRRCHYFITPTFKEKMEKTAWRANTVRAVRPKLYMSTDSDTVEQTRLLGVPSALYRL